MAYHTGRAGRHSENGHKFKGRSHQSKGGPKSMGRPYDESGNGGNTSMQGDGTGKLYISGPIGRNGRRYDGKTEIS